MNGDDGDKFSKWANIIKTLGFPVAVACYFLLKDWFFTQDLISLQTKIALALDRLSQVINR